MKRPNILYIHAHDAGRYVSPYGHDVPTPNIMKLAGQGVTFTDAHCVGPTCSPSRAGLLSGQCAHSSGMVGLAHRGFRMSDYSKHLVHTLKGAGYLTALSGVQHEAPEREMLGYDVLLDCSKVDVDIARSAAEFLRDAPREPFFLSCGFFRPHRPFPELTAEDDPRRVKPPSPLPNTAGTRIDFAHYRAAVRCFDDGVGTVLAALDSAGLAENTIVVCTTDHGIAFPFMKCNLTHHGTGVFLIMRGPGGLEGGRVLDPLVSHVDVFPTLAELAAFDPPSWLQGRSLVPLVRGEVESVNEEIYSEVTFHAAYQPMRSVRTKRWNYVRRFGDMKTPVMPNCDDGESKEHLYLHGWKDRPLADEELYDLVFDPCERANLATDPAMAGALEDMRSRLDAWMKRTDDPLLAGHVALPEGAVASDPMGYSPGGAAYAGGG